MGSFGGGWVVLLTTAPTMGAVCVWVKTTDSADWTLNAHNAQNISDWGGVMPRKWPLMWMSAHISAYPKPVCHFLLNSVVQQTWQP